jgi:hypothetical protein
LKTIDEQIEATQETNSGFEMMGSRAVCSSIGLWYRKGTNFGFSKVVIVGNKKNELRRCSTTTARSSPGPPDVLRLAETARISLTPTEV